MLHSIVHRASYVMHYALCIVHNALCIVRHAYFSPKNIKSIQFAYFIECNKTKQLRTNKIGIFFSRNSFQNSKLVRLVITMCVALFRPRLIATPWPGLVPSNDRVSSGWFGVNSLGELVAGSNTRIVRWSANNSPTQLTRPVSQHRFRKLSREPARSFMASVVADQ